MAYSDSYNPLEGVAVIGMVGRFPGAASVDEFWSNLRQGIESISQFTPEELEPWGSEDSSVRADANYVRARGILSNIEWFDAAFFGMNPREAAVTDPQQRLFLEASWEALENAGYDPEKYAGSIGVYAGMSNNTYFLNHIHGQRDLIQSVGALQVMMANEKDYLATRVSYKLNLRGPSLNIYTACSTSLVAVCQAFAGLTSYQCDMALAGGISITLPQKRGYLYQEGAITSPDGHCRPFDARAGGTVFSNGFGIVVLKRLQDAIDDGDTIHAVIKGAALNNDGSKRVSFTAPSVDGQAEAISMAQALAGIDPGTISYVEAHGTATPLGDPVEIAGLTQAFRAGTSGRGFCAIGSVKSNIGHLDAAAGIAGLIKTTLALRYRQLPPSLHFTAPNPKLELENSPFFVNTALKEWEAGSSPRRAGVSSFGAGGTNSHVVMEEAPATPDSSPGKSQELLVLSARTPGALEQAAARLASHLDEHPGANLGDVAFTLQKGRRHFNCRRSVVVHNPQDAIARLRAKPEKAMTATIRERGGMAVAFLFPGQGVQYVNMGRGLYESSPVVKRAVDDCVEILREPLGLDLRRILYPAPGEDEEAQRQLTETWVTQPALFVIEYALAQFWISLGVRPQAMLGHSVGEYVAACLADVLSLQDALGLLAARARMMQDLPHGTMMAVRLPEAELVPTMPAGLSLAAVNSPVLCVVSGPTPLADEWQAHLKARGVATKKLGTSHAFHSAMMDPLEGPFTDLVRRTRRRHPQVPYLSNVTSTWITNEDVDDPGYWFRHLRQAVRFADGVRELLRQPNRLLLEVGPQQTLGTLARQHPARVDGHVVVASMPASTGKPEWEAWLAAVGQMWLTGHGIDWQELHRDAKRRRVPLPTYPFERKRHWVEPRPGANESAGSAAVTGPAERAPAEAEESTSPSSVNAMNTPITSSPGRKERLAGEIRAVVAELSGIAESGIALDSGFMELGFDSLFLTQASQALQKRFGVKIAFRQMADDLSSIDALAGYLDAKLAPDPVRANVAPLTTPSPTGASSTGAPADGVESGDMGRGGSLLERVIAQQMALMREQLELIRGGASTGSSPVSGVAAPSTSPVLPAVSHVTRPATEGDLKRFGPFKGIEVGPKGGLTQSQAAALAELIGRYNRRTAASKAYAQRHRDRFCDPRAAGNFRQMWKEMVYPIVCARSQGGKIWDIDDNEYVDVTLGFGSNYFGHRPEFVIRALDSQLGKGFEIGPQTPLAGEVADMLCAMTGMDRATFCNTGSEAVMAAIRVARTVTGRDKIVYFTGDYHGIFDEVLGHAGRPGARVAALPIAPGIPPLPNVIVLDYGVDGSLDVIREYADEIAAVIVEPIQSRHPELQPREFLHSLRQLTEQREIALVFDEVVTGFRIAPGGAQEYFGVRADLATYGKVIGGGMPIGVLAGKRRFMDALDGGMWQFGDDSYPEVGVTFFAGTFIRHPLVMAAAHATLLHLREAGPKLQERTTEKTRRLVDSLNDYFRDVQVPIRLQSFGSVFYYDFHPDLKYAGLLFYYLRDRGIHIWEGRVAQVCTAHTDEELARVVNAFQASIEEMQSAGFLPGRTGLPAMGRPAVSGTEPMVGTMGSAEDAFPLSESQREMWLGAQMRPEAAGPHHACTGLWLEGPLDTDQLRRAIGLVVERHESLRSTFNADGTEVIVHPPRGSDLLFVDDLCDDPDPERDARVDRILAEEARRLLDLESGPLVYFRLLRLGPERHLLILKAQMIVCDGWSHYLVFEEVASAYSAYVSGKEPALKPSVRMREFARWQRDHAVTEEARNSEAFWLDQFRNVPPVLNLPTSRPRPPARTYEASRYDLTLATDLCQGIRRSARDQRKSYFAVLLAAFQVWLHRLSGCRDLVVGVPSAAQPPLGMDLFVGQCANTLPLRSLMDPEEPFAQFLARTWSRVLDAQEHWDFTFGQLAAKLDLPLDTSRIPLVSVLFNLDAPMSKVHFTGLKHRFFTGPRFYYQYDIGFNLVEEEDGCIRVECDYNSNLFDAEVVAAWTAGYEALLHAIVRDIHQRLGHLPMTAAYEARAQIRSGPGEKALADVNLHGLVTSQAALTPDAIAVESNGLRLSYAELHREASKVTEHMARLGVGPGRLVGVCVERSVRLPVALVGILGTGAAYLPMDSAWSNDELARTISEGGADLVVVDASTKDAFGSAVVRRVMLEDTLVEPDSSGDEPGQVPAVRVPSDAPAYVSCSRGPSGDRTAVRISHRALANLLLSMQVEPGFRAQDSMLCLSPIISDRSQIELWLPLTVGGRVVIVPSAMATDSSALADAIEHQGITVMQTTPSIWRRLVVNGWSGCSRLRAWSGGEALRPDLAERLLPLCGELWNLYGSAEATIWSMTARVQAGGQVSLGRPVAGTTVRVLDRLLQPVPVGVPGEIVICGAGLARGYVGWTEKTARKFIDHPLGVDVVGRIYLTGDLAKYGVDGQIEYVGRVDSPIEIRGFRIDVGDVELAMTRHEAVSQAMAIVREDTPGQKLLVGYVRPTRDGLSGEDLHNFLREQLPSYLVPTQFVILSEFPLTESHKVDISRLPKPDEKPPAPDEHRRNRKVAFVAPRTATEKALAEIWAQVLRIEQLGVNDNFFDLGGESMLAMRVVMLAGRKGMALKPRSVFLHKTIAELATVADRPDSTRIVARPAEDGATGPVPLTPAQIRFLHGRETLDPHHWNCSKLIRGRALNADAIKAALVALLGHHDALRLRLWNQNGEWNQCVVEPGGEVPFESHDLSGLDSKTQLERIRTRCAELQTSLNLAQGPVLRAAYFGCGPEHPDRVFVTMHHFVSDELSWDVFWEDFETAYKQAATGGEIQLPHKTTSFREWSLKLRRMADSEAVRNAASQWLALPWNDVRRLPLDFAELSDANTNASAELCEVLLGAKETKQIMRPDGDFRPEEVMLTALALTLGKWAGSRAVLIESLNHGRGIIEEADLSRTLGFMLCYQPLLLRVGGDSELQEILPDSVKQIRRLPDGFTFDLLRLFGGDDAARSAFGRLPRAEVLFNFTGHQLEIESEEQGTFCRCDDECGPDHSPRNGRYYPLAVSGAIVGDRLRFRFVYSKNLHKRSTMERLAGSYRKSLLELVKVRSERMASCS